MSINVPQHEEVDEGHKLQNLVTSVIMRQSKRFTLNKAEQDLIERLRGSKYMMDDVNLGQEAKECLENTIRILRMMQSGGLRYDRKTREYVCEFAFPAIF